MKKTPISLSIAFLLSVSCVFPGKERQLHAKLELASLYSKEASTTPCLSQPDAEKILGQPVRLTESFTEKEDSIYKHKCTYQVATPDTDSNLYYVLEEYRDAASAHRAYAEILLTNTRMPGQRIIHDIGDEAWLHSDSENFHLILFRKGHVMVRIKINKVTRTTSLDELLKVVGEISLKV